MISQPGVFWQSIHSSACSAHTCAFFQLQIPAGVVSMVVSVEDMAELPSQLIALLQDCLGVGRVDGCCGSSLGVVNQQAVVVIQHWKLNNLHLPSRSVSRGAAHCHLLQVQLGSVHQCVGLQTPLGSAGAQLPQHASYALHLCVHCILVAACR